MSKTHMALIDDLAAEVAALDAVVSGLDDAGWMTQTPAPGWRVAEQVAHLVIFDERCKWGISDADSFTRDLENIRSSGGFSAIESGYLSLGREELRRTWIEGAAELRDAGRAADPKARCQWYGPSMSATSMLTARLMETWAHGYDICDAIGVTPVATDRLRHVAHIGVNARPFAYAANRMTMPEVPVRVELRSPSGETWTWGPDADDVVRGDALGFCLAATQRRHVSDCGLETMGDAAREWMSIVQAFAGPPGEGREPGQFG
jgi:uncharacterized protein (TIGR03084 family)